MVIFAVYFFFNILEEAFTACAIKGIKNLYHVQSIQKLTECKGSILSPAVEMERKTIRDLSLFVCFLKLKWSMGHVIFPQNAVFYNFKYVLQKIEDCFWLGWIL